MPNALTDPPFMNDPPFKFNVNAKILGLVIGIIGVVLLVLVLIALPVVFAVASACTALGCHSGIFFLAILGAIIGIIGTILATVGGFQMYGANPRGKANVIYGLALRVVGSIIGLVGYGDVTNLVISLIVFAIIYYLVIISRFPGEVPLVASTSGGYGGYGGGYGGGTTPPPPPAAV